MLNYTCTHLSMGITLMGIILITDHNYSVSSYTDVASKFINSLTSYIHVYSYIIYCNSWVYMIQLKSCIARTHNNSQINMLLENGYFCMHHVIIKD